VLPGARRDTVVGAGEIGFGNLQIERGLTERLILGEDDLLGGITILGFQTESLSGLGIDAVEFVAALTAVDQTETSFHRHCVQPTREVNRVVTV